MNDLNTIMWTILETFDNMFYDLNLILLAIKLDEVASLLQQEPVPPPYTFNPLTNNLVFHQHPYAFLLTSHFDTYVPIAALSHSEDLHIENKEKLCL